MGWAECSKMDEHDHEQRHDQTHSGSAGLIVALVTQESSVIVR